MLHMNGILEVERFQPGLDGLLPDPASGSSLAEGSPVNLVISSGPQMVTVPNLQGLTQAAATEEDHDDARRYLDLFLRQLGAKVMVASKAFEGLELIKHSHPNLVLS
jgi:hypothetical protein